VLIGLLAALSLGGRQATGMAASGHGAAAGSLGGEGATGGLSERDRLFDVLCLGVVVLTVGLYVVFF
jgi:hypothetical protein